MTTRCAIALLLAATFPTLAAADDYVLPKERTTTRHDFGDVAILEEYDGRRAEPRWWIAVTRNGRGVGRLDGASFDELYADPAHDVFVGVSNRGVPDTSLVVFDARGETILHWPHGPKPGAYCAQSVTLVRTWLH